MWWNQQRLDTGKQPFGRNAIIQIVRGDEYALMYKRQPGPATEARRQTLRNCPYWGVCRTLRRAAPELQGLLDRLLYEGYIAIGAMDIDQTTTYEYFALTAKGQDQRLSAARLIWNSSSE